MTFEVVEAADVLSTEIYVWVAHVASVHRERAADHSANFWRHLVDLDLDENYFIFG